MLKIIFKQFKRSFIEAYNFVERKVKASNKVPFHRKILIAFVDNIN